MTWATASENQTTQSGEVHLAAASERAELEASAARAGLLLVPVEAPRPALRGRLALLIEGAVEEHLERRGAPPPGVGASSDLDASLSDQLYRARLVGTHGLAISLGSLEGIANLAGALDAEDSAVLRWWIAATRERPVRLILAANDRDLGVYDEPISLASLTGRRNGALSAIEPSARPPLAQPEVAASTETMQLGEPPPSVEIASRPEPPEIDELTPTPPPQSQKINDAEALMRAMAEIFDDEDDAAFEMADEFAPTEPADVVAVVEATPAEDAADWIRPAAEAMSAASPATEGAHEAHHDASSATVDDTSEETPSAPAADVLATTDEAGDAARDAGDSPEAAPEVEAIETATDASAEPHADAPAKQRAPLDPNAPREWQRWLAELDGTRGPKPLAVVERTFVSAFVPLLDAASRGIAGEEALPVLDAWKKSFAQSYAEAFDALRVRGKRPTMVLDVPDLALRIGRLHGARTAQLVLVDGMRFDLGIRVNERLKPLLGRSAALTERLLLWSALPSTTAIQLELIGRGPSGLKELNGQSDSEIPVARGRAAATLRRVRAGHREVLKLDLVESALSAPGGPLAERLDDLADEVAVTLANYLLRLPPRTLVIVFGDHGFVLDPVGGGTSAGRSGGASPEEVLVPAFAWLAGAVH